MRKPSARRDPAGGLAGQVALLAARASLAGLAAGARIVAARPALFGGIAVFSISAGLVADNALNRQAGPHRHPMLVTRGFEPQAPAVRPVREAAAKPAPIGNDPRILAFPLVREVQSLLAEQGYYSAEVDGRAGQATDLAIRAFQKDRGLRVDGMATPLLLTQIRAAGQVEEIDPTQVASLESPDVASDASGGGGSELVRQIQAGLSDAKVADLRADGILGERTRAAIRTFQALESLDVTGEPSQEVLDRLRAIAAR
ncbi:peptidoglycan-binding protein [Aureimonas sp. SK2]|uniref:peptidoglycan-binding domain-containing protein n=1 Tax=Aureimonas sp. SK2 TaxID=3015992 RepID=UPI0024450DB0|nr:peptidoglycan-binding protein [Aureimonas sp. SK2]